MTSIQLFLSYAAFLAGLFLLASFSVVHATVFAWKGEGGAHHFSNDPTEVPEKHRPSAQQFTSKLASKVTPADPAPVSPPLPAGDSLSAYERGVERGLLAAERQMEMTNELLKTTLQAVRQPPPPPQTIIIQQPSEPIIRYVDRDPPYFPQYGLFAPYVPYWGIPYRSFSPYGFRRGRLLRHSHFFPGTRRRNRGIFFPHGHSTQNGFLSGYGIVVR